MDDSEGNGKVDPEDEVSGAMPPPSTLHLKSLQAGIRLFAVYWLGTVFTIAVTIANPFDTRPGVVAFHLTLILGFIAALLCVPVARRVGGVVWIVSVWLVLALAFFTLDIATLPIAFLWGGPIVSVLCSRRLGIALGNSTIDRTARGVLLFQLLSLFSCGSLMATSTLEPVLFFGVGASWLASVVLLTRLYHDLQGTLSELVGRSSPPAA